MEKDFLIRQARFEDIPSITRIYNYAIEHTTATFDTEIKTVDDWLIAFSKHGDKYPIIVAVVDLKVVGWGLIKPFGERKAYRYTVEDAVYIDCNYQGQGLGSALLSELISIAREAGFHAMLALVVGGNAASLRLHEKFGFERVGFMKEVGRKFDRWLDVVVMEKLF